MVFFFNRKFRKSEKVYLALTKIFGIGQNYAKYLCSKIGCNVNTTVEQLNRINIGRLSYLLTKEALLDNELKRKLQEVWKQRLFFKTYKGIRFRQNLPVNGQNTKNNAQTSKKRKLN